MGSEQIPFVQHKFLRLGCRLRGGGKCPLLGVLALRRLAPACTHQEDQPTRGGCAQKAR